MPPVIQFAAPYQNSNFEVIAVPITLSNEGARTATVLSMELAVTDPRTKATKKFYAADFGRWTMERTRSGAYEPFAPISLAGRTSRTESVLFYTRGDDQKPNELFREVGPYQFTLTLDVAESRDKPTVAFERSLLLLRRARLQRAHDPALLERLALIEQHRLDEMSAQTIRPAPGVDSGSGP